MEVNEVLKTHREFIEGMAIHGVRPNHDNHKLINVMNAAIQAEIITSFSKCTSCNEFTYTVDKIHNYCIANNWFEPVLFADKVIEELKEKVKSDVEKVLRQGK